MRVNNLRRTHAVFLSYRISAIVPTPPHPNQTRHQWSASPDKTYTSEPLSRGVFLTLHYHMHFINNRNEEIQANILEFGADRMQQPLHALMSGMWQFYCHSYFALISLCYMVIRLWTFSWMEPMCAAELTWYTLKLYNWSLMKHTWWNWHAVPGTAYWNMGHTAGTLCK